MKDNSRRVVFDSNKPNAKRSEPRTQLMIHGQLWCCDCYERMLFETGQHSRLVGFPLYRDALFSKVSK